MLSTVAASGASESRFGPTVPDEPAAWSVWQLAQLSANTASPDAGAAAPAGAVAAGLSAPMSSGPTSSTSTTNAAAIQVSGASTRSIALSIRAPGSRSRR